MPLIIIGCGAVGSHVGLCAAKMGFSNFVLFDADIVEEHNLPNQTYEPEHVGQPKVEALAAVLKRFNPEIQVECRNEFFTEAYASALQGFVVIATDNMESRKMLIKLATLNPLVDGMFEARLGFDYGEVNIVDPLSVVDCDNFANGLRDDSDIPEGPCNLRICTTLVGIVTSHLVHQMCAAVVARKNSAEWQYKRKNIFNLSPILQHVCF
jgi:hypothetical protein